MGRPRPVPACLASWAEILSPVRTISMARDFPTARVSLWVPPAPAGVEGRQSRLALWLVQAKMLQTRCRQAERLKMGLLGRGGGVQKEVRQPVGGEAGRLRNWAKGGPYPCSGPPWHRGPRISTCRAAVRPWTDARSLQLPTSNPAAPRGVPAALDMPFSPGSLRLSGPRKLPHMSAHPPASWREHRLPGHGTHTEPWVPG